jgi:hypothetical protein
MSESFFSQIFPVSPWEGVGQRPTDDNSFHGDPEVFSMLIEAIRPKLIIEVGSWKGHSANHMADMARKLDLTVRIICVDTWLGSVEHWAKEKWRPDLHIEHGRPTIWERFQGNTMARGNQNLIYPLPMPSSQASALMRRFGVAADLIYIDGAHDYSSVRADLSGFFPLLAPEGVMFGDDYPHEPVRQAVHDFAAESGVAVMASGRRKWILDTPRAAQITGLPPQRIR